MDFRTLMLVIHAVTAVLGVGQILTMALVAGTSNGIADPFPLLMRLVRVASWALAIMFLSGLAVLAASGWAQIQAVWFWTGIALYVAIGALMGIAQGRIRRAMHDSAIAPAALRRVSRLASIACALVAAVVVLMVAKPF